MNPHPHRFVGPLRAAAFCLALGFAIPTSAAAAPDPGWPRVHTTTSGARMEIYQPQIASWERQAHLVAYVAIAYTPKGAAAPAIGTVRVEADTNVALEQRLVSFATFTITEAHFASPGRMQTREILAAIEKAIPSVERVIALDRVLAGLDRSQIRPSNVDGVKAEPPVIYFSATPAVLVNFDGAPIWSPIDRTDLKYAVNTNWDVFEHTPSKTLYLRHDQVWLKASALEGPWLPAGTLPAGFMKLPWDENWTKVKASLPGGRIAPGDVPAIFVSTKPAELILLRGAPRYVPVSTTMMPGAATTPPASERATAEPLLWIENTDSDVFRVGATGAVYCLVAGRWFSAPDFSGPWTFATPALPAAFRAIPTDHPRARVLASVPGTTQAAEAVVLAQIPQTARVHKQHVTAPEIRYQGAPRFVAIEQTTLLRAANTDMAVIKAGDLYYLCVQGVWFVASAPRGPWTVTGRVPQVIYTIPASSPLHHVTYVTIVEDNADWVVVAARGGYTGTMIAWGCAVWGTGWYYPPYVWYGGSVPVYYPFYATYGAAAWFDPRVGSYARGAVAYGPYGGAGAAARYNPYTGTYARGAAARTPYGARGAGQAYNPYTGAYGQTRQGAGVYGSWGSSYVQRGDDWARTARVTNDVTGVTSRVARTDDGAMIGRAGPNGGGFLAAGEEGIYAGRDGNVYRRADGGGWQKYENGAWGTVDRSAVGQQLERDRAARIEGSQRVRERGAAPASAPANAPAVSNLPERPANLPARGPRANGGGPRGGGARGGGRRR
jgi:hypothetical protein